VNRLYKKKRRKKYKKLWNNTTPLNQYKEKINVDLDFIIQERKHRYAKEESLFNCYGYYYLKRKVEPVIKDQSKKCYSEPRECRSETEDCECEAQTIYHHSNIDERCAAANTKVSYIKANGSQSRVVESTNNLIDRNICLTFGNKSEDFD
jgi:hypothetical protein